MFRGMRFVKRDVKYVTLKTPGMLLLIHIRALRHDTHFAGLVGVSVLASSRRPKYILVCTWHGSRMRV